MHNITLRLGTRQDVPEIMDIMTAAHRAMADPSAYITDEEEYVSAHVDGAGFILLGEVDGTAAGFFLVCLPGLGENNLGHYLDFSREQLLRTAIMDSAAVRPEYQGLGLMGKMFREAVRRTAGRYDYLLGTVAPDNIPSLRNFEKCGFQRLKLVVKPGGQKRLLMGRFRETPEATRW